MLCVRVLQRQLALDHTQEERRHSRIPLTPSAPLRQLPWQLKDHLHLRIHHRKVWIQCTPVNNNSHALYKSLWCVYVSVCKRVVCECKLATLNIVCSMVNWYPAVAWPRKKNGFVDYDLPRLMIALFLVSREVQSFFSKCSYIMEARSWQSRDSCALINCLLLNPNYIFRVCASGGAAWHKFNPHNHKLWVPRAVSVPANVWTCRCMQTPNVNRTVYM